jgi:SAM-dependent methyltransferase
MISRQTLRRIRAPFRRVRGRLAMGMGRAARATPLSRDFGYSRGTPIDRYYIERFLEEHSADVHGRVLEIGDDAYSLRFGGDRILKQDILHIQNGHPGATIIGDLANPTVLPERTFDCMIITQTLHLIFDLPSALEQIHRSLTPGGVALLTLPGITPVDRGEWKDSWYWSVTELSMKRLLNGPFLAANVTVKTYGNLLAATAFLHGAAVEEVGAERLDPFDPAYPVTVAARVVS